MRVELRRAGIDGLVRDAHAGGQARRAHRRRIGAPEERELRVGEAELLGVPPVGPAHRAEADAREAVALLDDQQDLVAEPRVDPGGLVHPLDRHEPAERGLDLEDALGGGHGRGADELVVVVVVELVLGRVAVEAEPAGFEGPQRLLQRFRERPADRHHLADRLHLRAEHRHRTGQLLERPTRDLGDDVVDRRLERRGRLAGDVVAHLVEPVADRELRGDLRDREAGRLARQRARTRHARVHLDDDLLAGTRIDCELHVGPAGLDTDTADARERGVSHPLVLDVGERLGGSDRDRLAGVHAHRVEVLDRADDDHVVGVVAHDLELVLLPSDDAALDEDLGDRARGEAPFGDALHLALVVCDAGAATAEDERGAHDHRVADLGRDRERLVDRIRDTRRRHAQADLGHRVLEALTILGGADRLGLRTDHLDTERVEHARLVERDPRG